MAAADDTSRLNGHADNASTELLFSRHIDSVYRFLYRQMGNAEDAEDLTSQVFRRAEQQLDSGRPESAVTASLFTLARVVLAEHWSRWYQGPSRWDRGDAPYVRSVAVAPLAAPRAGSAGGVNKVLDALPEGERWVLELRFVKGRSLQDSAAALGLSTDAVRAIEHRALLQAARVYDRCPSPQ